MEPPDLGDLYVIIFLVEFAPLVLGLILLIILLLVCSALVSGSEIAYFSLGPNDIKDLESDTTRESNKRILQLKAKPRSLLATILIANNFVNIAIVLVSNYLTGLVFPKVFFDNIAKWVVDLFGKIGWNLSIVSTSSVVQLLITVIGVTFFLVVFGEIIPKIYANINNVKLARVMARPLTILSSLFYPISSLLVNWSIKVEQRLIKDRSASIKEDIDHAIELTVRNNDESTEEEVDILKSIVKFSDVSVKQVMCSRVDVVAIDIETKYNDLLKTVKESGFSRIPVYKEDFDHVEGILYVKDLLGYLSKGEEFKWQKLINKEVLYTPESKKINELLKEIQVKRTHMAIVVDEYGGSSGIITLEDIMEEVIGEIKDEFDVEEIEYIKLDDHNYIFDGKTLLNDMAKIIGIEIDELDKLRGESDSLAGLVLEQTGLIPKVNRIIKIPNNITIKILAANKRRIEKLQITYRE